MRVSLAPALVAGLLVAIGCAKEEKEKPAAGALDGSYRTIRINFLGKWIDVTDDMEMTVRDGTMTSRGGVFGEGTHPIKTDESKAPPEVDLLKAEDGKITTEAYGIYKFEGDELTVVFTVNEKDGRPKDFLPGEWRVIFVLKRK